MNRGRTTMNGDRSTVNGGRNTMNRRGINVTEGKDRWTEVKIL